MKFTYTLKKDEYAKGLMLFNPRKPYVVFGFFFVLAATISHGIGDYYIDAPLWGVKLFIYFLVYTLGCVLFLFIMKYLLIVLVKLGHKKNKIQSKPMHMELTDEGIDVDFSLGKSFLRWDAFEKYQCTDELCILFLTKNLRYIVPLRIFNKEEEVAFKQLLSQQIKNNDVPRIDET